MPRIIILILLMSVASTVSAGCKQSDLAGRWEFNFNLSGVAHACRFFITEEGGINKGHCWKYETNWLSFRVVETDIGKIAFFVPPGITVNGYCKVEGLFFSVSGASPGPSYAFSLATGRLNLEKSIISGQMNLDSPNGSSVPGSASYTMVKY